MNNFVEKYQEPWRAEFWIFGLKTTYDIADDDDSTDDDTNDDTDDSTEIVSQDEKEFRNEKLFYLEQKIWRKLKVTTFKNKQSSKSWFLINKHKKM